MSCCEFFEDTEVSMGPRILRRAVPDRSQVLWLVVQEEARSSCLSYETHRASAKFHRACMLTPHRQTTPCTVQRRCVSASAMLRRYFRKKRVACLKARCPRRAAVFACSSLIETCSLEWPPLVERDRELRGSKNSALATHHVFTRSRARRNRHPASCAPRSSGSDGKVLHSSRARYVLTPPGSATTCRHEVSR
jgi:hypothetical protein